MKKTNIWAFTLLLFAGIGLESCNQTDTDSKYITVDVKGNYPKKEISLQDFMDVEYIPLETTDEFITQGSIKDIGKKYVLVTNRFNDGNIFIFDRQSGKGIRKINRQGQGAEEYVRISGIILDEDNGEIFVSTTPGNRMLVYDLNGTFRRSLNIDRQVTSVYNYNADNLICYDMSDYHDKGKDRTGAYHILISKKDGSITKEIFIPFKTINTPVVRDKDRFIANYSYQLRPSNGQYTLIETSSDTLYNYGPDGTLTPFLVRTPSVNTMDPEIFLYMGIHTDRFYFMETVENTFNFEKGSGFYPNVLMYDKLDKSVYQVTVYNADYKDKKRVAVTARPINNEIEGAVSLEASQLKDAYEADKLANGRLKEIASKLGEEDNPVIMLLKQK